MKKLTTYLLLSIIPLMGLSGIAQSPWQMYDSCGNITTINADPCAGTFTWGNIAGFTGTTAEFNTALSDGSFSTGGGTATGTNTGDEVAATESVAGIAEIATSGEITTGTDNGRIVSPLGLEGWNGGSGIITVGTLTAGTWNADDIAFGNIADIAAVSLFGNPTGCSAPGTNVPLGAGLGFDGCGNLENTSMNGALALLQIRRSTSLALTTCFVDVTFNQTDHETIAATLEHNNTNTDDIDFKVNGFYRVTVNGHAELTQAGCSLSADINYRMRLNDTTVFNGSCYGPVGLRSGNCQTNNAYVGSSFFVNITCAPDKGTFQMNEAGGNIILIECLTITVEQQ